jgi:hypothetical protein
MNTTRSGYLVPGAVIILGIIALSYTAQSSAETISPHPDWDCYLPGGIPIPEDGALILELSIPLVRAESIGTTQYGERNIGVGGAGSFQGPQLSGEVVEGGLDYQLLLSNGTLEIEQILVLQAADGGYVYVRNAGVGPDADDVRVVMDFEAPTASEYAWLNSGRYVARRDLDSARMTLTMRVYDVTDVSVTADNATDITKPDGIPAQPWNYREKGSGEEPGEILITENVTLGPSQSVGPSKRGNRNIIPITGGEVTGRLSGKVLFGGADYQNLTPPATIDAQYLWQADDGEIIIVRNGGSFGSLVPTFEARIDGPYAWLNDGLWLSSNPGMGQGGVSLTFYESTGQ